MPNVRPINDLQNAMEISELCHSTDEPVFITKNGCSDMVVMSSEVYEKFMALSEIFKTLSRSAEDIAAGKGMDGNAVLARLREKYGYEV